MPRLRVLPEVSASARRQGQTYLSMLSNVTAALLTTEKTMGWLVGELQPPKDPRY